MILTIDEPTPSVNRLHGYQWAKKHRERKKWGWLVKSAVLAARLPPRYPPELAHWRIERFGRRILDYSNFVAGCKWLEDALVAEGFAIDDSPKHLKVEYVQHQVRGKERQRTLVCVKPSLAVESRA